MMENLISVAKASRLLGIKRSDLNEQLRAADIPTFEGNVDFEAVRAIAPAISLCESEILDRVRYIRENAAKTDRHETETRSVQELSAEVSKLRTDLMVEKRTSDHYEQILVDLARQLGELQSSENEETRATALGLCNWLRENIRS
jgi:CDP-4-dehydro-6-deoxyglucose reductase, E3